MRVFQGNTNLKNSIVGRLSLVAMDDKKENYIYKVNGIEGENYGCILCSPNINFHDSLIIKNFYFRLNDQKTRLYQGDVVLLQPNGTGSVLYEINSNSNVIIPTEQCNSNCIICSQPPKPDKENLINLCKKVILLMDRNSEVICISGGEPTVEWNGLLEIIDLCSHILQNTVIFLLTNGRIISDYEKAKELKKVGGSKLYVGIPIYSDVDNIHDMIVGVKDAFWETIEGIYNLERLDIPIEIRTVVMKQNYQRLPQMAEFIYHNFPFVNHVAFMGLEPIGLAEKNFKDIWINVSEYINEITASANLFNRYRLSFSLYNYQLCIIPYYLWKFARKSISEWKNIYFAECNSCDKIQECCGFFQSEYNFYRYKKILPIRLT